MGKSLPNLAASAGGIRSIIDSPEWQQAMGKSLPNLAASAGGIRSIIDSPEWQQAMGKSLPNLAASLGEIRSALRSPSLIDSAVARQMNDRLAAANLYPRVAPTAFAAATHEAALPATEMMGTMSEWSEADRYAARPVVQLAIAVLWCAWMADTYLSTNELAKLIQELSQVMGLPLSVGVVWVLVGKAFDAVWPSSVGSDVQSEQSSRHKRPPPPHGVQ